MVAVDLGEHSDSMPDRRERERTQFAFKTMTDEEGVDGG
jgi:hypothetical protein